MRTIAYVCGLLLLCGASFAQLYDPNRGCVYGTDPNNCQHIQPLPNYQPAPRVPTREDVCHQRQEECMASCVPSNGFYTCFGTICADDHTRCMHGQ